MKLFQKAFSKTVAHTKKAREYLSIHYREESLQISHKPAISDNDSGIRYSERDSYCPDNIEETIRKFRAGNDMSTFDKSMRKSMDISFSEKLVELIDERRLRDVAVYKAAQIDRRLFSKIVSSVDYKPSKDTALALCIALKLSVAETNDLLARAGYVLSHSDKRDVVLEFVLKEKIHNINTVNEILYNLGMKPLGR